MGTYIIILIENINNASMSADDEFFLNVGNIKCEE